MSGRTDGKNPFQTEVPLQFRFQEREDKTAGSSIHVNWNIVAGLCIVGIECLIQSLHIIVQTCPCNPLDRHNTDCIFITHLQCFFGIERSLLQCQRHLTHFDLPKLGEFFPYNLKSGRNNEVRLIHRLTGGLPFLTPAQPSCDTSQHTCFGRTDSQCTGFPFCLFGSIPQIRYDVDTFGVHDGNTRIFRFIDIVDVDRLVHKFGCIVVHIGSYECRQVQAGLCLCKRFVFNHLIRDFRGGRTIRDFVYRRGL